METSDIKEELLSELDGSPEKHPIVREESEPNISLKSTVDDQLEAEKGNSSDSDSVYHTADEGEKSVDISFEQDFGSSSALITFLMLFATLFSILGGLTYVSSQKQRTLKKLDIHPFFKHEVDENIFDYSNGSTNGLSDGHTSFNMLYSPHSFTSKRFRQDFIRAASKLNEQQQNINVRFNAVNCFTKKGDCSKKYKVIKFPVIYGHIGNHGTSIYNGPPSEVYLNRWMNRLLNILVRVATVEDLGAIFMQYRMVVLVYIPTMNHADNVYLHNFTKAAVEYSNGDPNIEVFTYGVLTSPSLAQLLGVHELNSVLIMNSDLETMIIVKQHEWSSGRLNEFVKMSLMAVLRKNIYFMNKPVNNLATEQLSTILNNNTALILSQKAPHFQKKTFQLFQQATHDYWTCNNYVSLQKDDEYSSRGLGCNNNVTPLQFVNVDTDLFPQFDEKVDGSESLVSVNSFIEMAEVLNNTAGIDATIMQHHEYSDNPFVVDSTSPYTEHQKQKEHVANNFGVIEVDSVYDFLNKTKDFIVLFTAGVSHGPSMSALFEFHLISAYHKDLRSMLQFAILDTSKVQVPFNFNFDKLPRIILSRAKSISASYVFSEHMPITVPTLFNFTREKSSVSVRVAIMLKNCDQRCRVRNTRKLRNEKKRLRRALIRMSFIERRLRRRLAEVCTLLRIIAY